MSGLCLMNPLEVSADEFRRLAAHITELASEYLEHLDSQKITPATTGADTLRLFRTPLPEAGLGADALKALPQVVQRSRTQNGRFFGYVLGSGEPAGGPPFDLS